MTKLLRNNFFIALLLLLGYMYTSPYIYGWDDQHLEIPILKHLIDPTLYKGDYYVESATKYFTCWLYPVLAHFITVKQIPATYQILFLISRYVMFFFVYRLWLLISGSAFSAFCASFAFFIMGRTDEFLYRSFCHEEFSFMFMFAGIYLFYRERYVLAAFLFGLGVNTHAIYNLFPMLYMVAFLLFCHPKRFKLIFQTGTVFVVASLPFLLWQIPISLSREVAHPVPASEWMPMYMLSCFQNFLFGSASLNDVLTNIHTWWSCTTPYLLLLGLYFFHLVFNPLLRQDKKLHAIIGTSVALLGVIFYFDYIHPSRFVVDLNIVRVEQYMRFFLMGYTAVWATIQVREAKPWLAFCAVVLLLSCGTVDLIALFFLLIVAMVFITDAILQKPFNIYKHIWGVVFLVVLGALAYVVSLELKTYPQVVIYGKRHIYVLAGMALVLFILFFKSSNLWLRRLLIIIPLLGTFGVCVYDYFEYWDLKKSGPSGWQLQRNWEDMQFFVRDHTPKDALILTPYDMPMGGFRIHSERKVLACYRDCGIIGFDYAAAQEWNRRINDIEPFKVFSREDIKAAVLVAILKYKVNFVVFMNYYGPTEDTPLLKKVYANEVFSLYQVL